MVYSRIHDPIGRIVPAEIKFTDFGTNAIVTNTGTIFTLTMPAQGTSSNQRVGDRLHILKLDMQMYLTLATANSDVVRIIFFQEKGLASTTPTASSILQSVTPTSQLLYNARDLYHILYDELFGVCVNSSTSIRVVRTGLKIPIKDIHFVSGSTTPFSGQIWALALTSSVSSITMAGSHRLYFEDGN